MKKKVLFALIALLSCLTTWATDVANEAVLKSVFEQGGVAKLTTTIMLSTEVNVAEGKTVTLDLNGNSIIYAGPWITTGVIGVPRGATLIVDDSSVLKDGMINGSYGNQAMAGIAVTKLGDDATKVARLTVNAGQIFGKDYGISGNGNRNGSEIVINGGTIKSTDTTEGTGIYNPQAGTLTINGGYIEGYDAAVEVRSGNVTVAVNGGQFVAKSETYSCGPNGNGTTTSGAAFAVAQHTTAQPISVSIAGGTFTGPVALSIMNPQNGTADNVTVGVTGGTFNGDVVIADARVNPSAILTGGAEFNPSFQVSAPAAQTFTGSALTPALTVTKDNVETNDYVMRYFNANGQEVPQIINAGNYTVVVGLSNVNNPAYLTTVPFSVNPKAFSDDLSVSTTQPFYYTGQVQQPFVYTADPEPSYTTATGWVVKDGPANQATSTPLVYGTDFTVTYQAQSSYTTAGEWSFVVNGTGNYTGSRELNYNINKAFLTASNFSLIPAEYTFNGTEQKPQVVPGTGINAVEGTDFTVSYVEGSDGIKAGTQELKLTAVANGNFRLGAWNQAFEDGDVIKAYTIKPASNDALTVAWSTDAGPDLTYNGIEQKPEVPGAEVTDADPIVVTALINEVATRLVKNVDYTIAYNGLDYTNAGEKEITITGIGNYANPTGTSQAPVKTLTYTIKRRQINSTDITVSTVPADFTFNDQEQKPSEFVVKDNGLAPTADHPYTLTGDDYYVTYTDEDDDYTSAGDKPFTLTGKGNYTGTSEKTYRINGYLVTINGAMVEKTYGDVDPAPDFNVDAASDYKPSKQDIAPYLQFAREENGEDVKIVKVGNTDAWTIGTYDYRVEANPENPQADYNFQFLQQGSKLKINQRPLTITVLPQSKVFGTADAIDQTKISVEGLAYNQAIGIDDRDAVVTVKITREPEEEGAELEEAKGTYRDVLKAELVSVVLGDKDITNNYKVGEIIPGNFTIDPEPVGDVTIVGYKQTGTEEVPVYEIVYTVDGDNEVVYAGRNIQPVDKWTVTKGETELVPDVDYTVTVVNSENATEFEWNVDKYTYTFNFQGNYSNNKDPETGEVIPTTAELDIVPAPLTITYKGQAVAFGNPLTAANAWDDFTFGVTTQDPETGDDITENTFVNNETATFALTGTPVIISEYENEGEDAWGAGSYQKVLDIEGIEAVNGNYDITLVRGDLTVNKAVLEVVYIKQGDIVYNGSNPFAPTLVDGEGKAIAGITYTQDIFTYTKDETVVENPRNVGTYTISVTDEDLTGITSDNFEVAEVWPVVAKITKKAATITAEDKEMAFGATVPELTATYDGFLLGEEAGLTVAFTIDNAPVAESYDYGTHTIRVSEVGNLDEENDVVQNYNITTVEGTLTVGTASDALVFAISAEPQTYNGLAFDFNAYKTATPANLSIEYVSGMLAADEADETKKAAIIAAVEEAVQYVLADGDPIKEEGTYAGRITATAAPENFNYNVTFTPADLVIEPYKITIEILDQTIAYGQQPKLNAVLGQTVNYVTPNKLASGDKLADLNITLSVDAENNIKATYNNHNYDITFIDGELTINYDEQIALVRPLLNTQALWNAPVQQGHELIFTNAEMTAVAPEGDIVDNTAAQLIADYDGKKVNVTFGHFAMQPDQWYPLVLPFDMNVKTISKNFGYAVIDVVDPEKSSAEHISFKIDIHDIPANTPFLIKVPEPIDMADVTFLAQEDPKFCSIEKIVNPADKAALSVDITDGNKFVGTYTGYNRFLEGTDVQRGYLASDGKLYPNSSKFYVFPLGAYFEYGEGVNSANVRISIEEPDGTTTTISAVEADAEGAEYAEGWYTVTGVKLTAEPTVSGTYIYNGQKVYIKK